MNVTTNTNHIGIAIKLHSTFERSEHYPYPFSDTNAVAHAKTVHVLIAQKPNKFPELKKMKKKYRK